MFLPCFLEILMKILDVRSIVSSTALGWIYDAGPCQPIPSYLDITQVAGWVSSRPL